MPHLPRTPKAPAEIIALRNSASKLQDEVQKLSGMQHPKLDILFVTKPGLRKTFEDFCAKSGGVFTNNKLAAYHDEVIDTLHSLYGLDALRDVATGKIARLKPKEGVRVTPYSGDMPLNVRLLALDKFASELGSGVKEPHSPEVSRFFTVTSFLEGPWTNNAMREFKRKQELTAALDNRIFTLGLELVKHPLQGWVASRELLRKLSSGALGEVHFNRLAEWVEAEADEASTERLIDATKASEEKLRGSLNLMKASEGFVSALKKKAGEHGLQEQWKESGLDSILDFLSKHKK